MDFGFAENYSGNGTISTNLATSGPSANKDQEAMQFLFFMKINIV
jgi:hypothetical protein